MLISNSHKSYSQRVYVPGEAASSSFFQEVETETNVELLQSVSYRSVALVVKYWENKQHMEHNSSRSYLGFTTSHKFY